MVDKVFLVTLKTRPNKGFTMILDEVEHEFWALPNSLIEIRQKINITNISELKESSMKAVCTKHTKPTTSPSSAFKVENFYKVTQGLKFYTVVDDTGKTHKASLSNDGLLWIFYPSHSGVNESVYLKLQ